MSDAVKRSQVDGLALDRLLGLESSKIGFYGEVKQKIQELEAANLGLRTKQSELQAVFDAIGDGVLIYGNKGLLQHRNHIGPRLFPRETMVGKSCSALFHPEQEFSPLGCPVESALQGRSVQVSQVLKDAHGQPLYLDVSATPLEDPSGVNRALVFIRDVTARRHQEMQLVQAEKMSSIGVLAAGVAHEINNPLSSIAGYAEALVRRFRDDDWMKQDPRLEDFPHYLEVIIREAYRCKGIIDSLLSFSRRSDGRMGSVHINALIQEVLELVCIRARYEKIRFEEHFQPDLPQVRGDAAALRQVFMNLIMNALQAIEGGGLIEISTLLRGGEVVVEVKDNGPGIPEAIRDQIWNPFFTTKEVGQGSGLGLAVSYNIVKKHQGEIEVESQQGQGALFTVRLPVCPGM